MCSVPRLCSRARCPQSHRGARVALLAVSLLCIWATPGGNPPLPTASAARAVRVPSAMPGLRLCAGTGAPASSEPSGAGDALVADAPQDAVTTSAAAVLDSDVDVASVLLLVSVTWGENNPDFFVYWLRTTARALQLPYVVVVSTGTAELAATLSAAATSAGVAGARLLFSPPSPRDPLRRKLAPLIGPSLLRAHVANVRAAGTAGVAFSHAIAVASNCLWLRTIDARSFLAFARRIAAPLVVEPALGINGWYYNAMLMRDNATLAWRARLAAAAGEECITFYGACVTDAARCAPDACTVSKLRTWDGLLAPAHAWLDVLLPAAEDFLATRAAALSAAGVITGVGSGNGTFASPAEEEAVARELHSAYPMEEVIFATAAIVARSACPSLQFDFVVAGFTEWAGGAIHEGGADDLRAMQVRPHSVLALRALGAHAPLLVKRVPRDSSDPLTQLVADYDTPWDPNQKVRRVPEGWRTRDTTTTHNHEPG